MSPIPMITKLTDENYLQYCMKFYDSPQCHTVKEFEEDMNRILYLSKALRGYATDKGLNENLIINHLIILFNLFGEGTVNILFFKLPKEYWNVIITFLIFINRMPDTVPMFHINTVDYPLDTYTISTLRRISDVKNSR